VEETGAAENCAVWLREIGQLHWKRLEFASTDLARADFGHLARFSMASFTIAVGQGTIQVMASFATPSEFDCPMYTATSFHHKRTRDLRVAT
jgi:hypothetical protein